tara:strand:+ start:48 stop:197 length:150 start_codon:yes stop_codon:yes gene_type:complete
LRELYVLLNFNNKWFVEEEMRLIFKIVIFTIMLGGWLYRKIHNTEVVRL